MERINPIRENIIRVHGHLMEKGIGYSAILGTTTIIGGMLKQDPVSLAGGFIIIGGATVVKNIDKGPFSKTGDKGGK